MKISKRGDIAIIGDDEEQERISLCPRCLDNDQYNPLEAKGLLT
jgi:hypothetical protein